MNMIELVFGVIVGLIVMMSGFVIISYDNGNCDTVDIEGSFECDMERARHLVVPSFSLLMGILIIITTIYKKMSENKSIRTTDRQRDEKKDKDTKVSKTTNESYEKWGEL